MTTTSNASTPRRSIEIEEVEDENHRSNNLNAGPSNASRVVESSDDDPDEEGEAAGRGVARAQSVINIRDNSSDEEQAVTKADEAERGMIKSVIYWNMLLMPKQIALQKNGTHRSMHSSTLSRLLTTLETLRDVLMSSSATRRHVWAKARAGDMSGGTFTLPMGSQQAIFATMQSYAGAWTLLWGWTLRKCTVPLARLSTRP
jgi:hypothetical protein